MATVETLASEAAVEALRDGANAVDAAVVAAAVLGVTEPFSCGIGGGGFMVIRTSDGSVTTIDHRETGAGCDATELLLRKRRAAAVQRRALQRPVGRRARNRARLGRGPEPLRDDVARGGAAARIEVARDGFVIDQTFFSQTQQNLDYFDDVPSTRALYLDPDGTPRDVGTVLRNPDLARAYERIGHLGAKGFYRGAIADAMVEAVRHPPVAPDANHVWRARGDDHARRQGLHGARARADEGRLPRARRLQHGPAVERRLD